MEGARAAFEEALAGFAFADPMLPVYSNVTAGPIASGAEARALCGRQVVSPVRWVDEETRLLADGYGDFREAGPGTVLTGLFKALRPDVDRRPAEITLRTSIGRMTHAAEGKEGDRDRRLAGDRERHRGGVPPRGRGRARFSRNPRDNHGGAGEARRAPRAAPSPGGPWTSTDEEDSARPLEAIIAEAGSGRRARQQRGHHPRRPDLPHAHGGLGRGAARQPDLGVLRLPGRGPGHDEAARGIDRQHLVGQRHHGQRGPDQLRGLEGGTDRLLEEPRPGGRHAAGCA